MLHAWAEGGAEVGEAGKVAGQIGGDLYVLLGGVGYQLWETEVHQLAQAGAADDRLAHACDDRYAHPEGIEAGGVAVVGESVEANIDTVVEFEILLERAMGNELDALRRDTLFFHLSKRLLASAAFGGQQ